ncbi:hypothetical protein [Roseovarius atlanticus]|uniref:hypothetical protein n=1 Tax=Roseovarius atlanticus TaxID=1641875 RepID=UPI001C984325|nr:hypothetical protein [Roseovarius atlanticus]MBY5987857.1 hypothetical protein [Roseovarius atlanticus]MBY6123248.1 hypothetical protein [Roseovarius atlanticus]MBY6147743.1 hypothetical protein [Roseovarius atlanticus]
MKRFALAVLMGTLPVTATAGSLADELKNYVVAVDVAALDDEARAELRTIMDDPAKSHGNKVLSVHTVLDRNNALRDVDIHGGPLDEGEAQVDLASLD